MNKWWEIKIICDPNLEESLFWRLEKFGCHGTASEVKGDSLFIRAYLLLLEVQPLDLAALVQWIRQDAVIVGVSEPSICWNLIDEKDWSILWQEYWQPRKIGDRFLINPAWLAPPNDSERIILRLEPGAAFGTGEHPTTQLCIESLEMRLGIPGHTNENKIIADIGCGSGILSISAILLGAQKIYAVDIDPLAVSATHHNCKLNQITSKQIIVTKGSANKLQKLNSEGFDGIICNILAEVIIKLIPQITTISKQTSWGILSGILLEQVQDVVDVLEEYGWTIATIWKREQWCCVNIRRF